MNEPKSKLESQQPELFVSDPRARRGTPFEPPAARDAKHQPAPISEAPQPEQAQPPLRRAVRFTEQPADSVPDAPRYPTRLEKPLPYRPDPASTVTHLANPANLQDGPSATRTLPSQRTDVLGNSAQRKPGWIAPQRVFVFGATSAIAIATQRLLVERGSSQFFLVARNAERLETVAADLRARGAGTVITAAADLDNTGAHEGLINEGLEALGGMDLTLLAHGVLGDQREAETNFQATEAVLVTNVLSPISLLTLLANYCESERRGTLAVISSVAGDRGRGSNYIYGTSKAALTAFVSGLRNRLDRHGVNVLTIKPGFVITPMTAGMKLGPLAATPQVIAEGIVSAVQKRRDVVYLPFFWRYIMAIIKIVPERIFKGMNT